MTRLVLLALALACQPMRGDRAAPIDASPRDAAPAPVPTPAHAGAGLEHECDRVFRHLEGLGCPPEGARTASWVEVCRTARAHGSTFGLECFRAASTCEAAEACRRGEP